MTSSDTHFPKSSTAFDYVNFLPKLLDTINTFAPLSTFELPNLKTNEDLGYKQSSEGNSIHLKITIGPFYKYIFHFNSSTISIDIEFETSNDFPEGLLQTNFNSRNENCLLIEKIQLLINETLDSSMVKKDMQKPSENDFRDMPSSPNG